MFLVDFDFQIVSRTDSTQGKPDALFRRRAYDERFIAATRGPEVSYA